MLKQIKQTLLNLRTPNTISLTRRNRLTGSTTTLEAKVMLASGTITISGTEKATAANLKKWQNAKHLKGSGTIDLQGKTLTMKNNPGGSITGLKFKNGGIKIIKSNNFKLSNNSLTASSGLVRAYNFADSSNITVSGNKASGKLSNGITVNGGSNHKVSNNTLTRKTNVGAGAGTKQEDHGIYILNTKGSNLSGNKASGWSTKPSGHGLKFKDTIDLKANGNSFGSMIGRNKNINYQIGGGQGKLDVDKGGKKTGNNKKGNNKKK
jgi:parallel beta-helix repeat protein